MTKKSGLIKILLSAIDNKDTQLLIDIAGQLSPDSLRKIKCGYQGSFSLLHKAAQKGLKEFADYLVKEKGFDWEVNNPRGYNARYYYDRYLRQNKEAV